MLREVSFEVAKEGRLVRSVEFIDKQTSAASFDVCAFVERALRSDVAINA